MALWEFKNLNKYGNFRTRIVHSKGSLGIGKGFGPIHMVRRFQYEHREQYPPMLLDINGKKYLMPQWKVVHPQTTLEDIKWVKPKPKTKPQLQVIKHEFTSSSSNSVYVTREKIDENGEITYACNCPGFYRAKDRKCKHIKSLENK